MNKTQQAVSLFAVCASIILAGVLVAYRPGLPEVSATGDWRYPSGIPPALSSTSFQSVAADVAPAHTLSISGAATATAKADQATVTLGVYTEDKAAGVAIDENAQLMTAVIAALKGAGLTDNDIKTTQYTVQPNYDWNVKMVISYQVTNIVQVTIKDLTKVGAIIDAASSAGANRVDGVSFSLSDAAMSTMKLSVYDNAVKDARAKADEIVKALVSGGMTISISGVQSVSESGYYYPVPYQSYAMDSSGVKSSTPIVQGNLTVTVTVNIVYLLSP